MTVDCYAYFSHHTSPLLSSHRRIPSCRTVIPTHPPTHTHPHTHTHAVTLSIYFLPIIMSSMPIDAQALLELLGGPLVVSNIVWMFIAVALYSTMKPKKQDKFTDRQWQLLQDAEDAQIVTKDGKGGIGHEAEQYVPYAKYQKYEVSDMHERSVQFHKLLDGRRTVREYSTEDFPIEVIENCVKAAGTAPSGANLQPWTYAIVKDKALRSQIRQIVEDEEAVNYARRMNEAWKEDLAHLGTDASKPYLDDAPYLVCVFKHAYRVEDGERLSVYYPEQSVGISVGMFQVWLSICLQPHTHAHTQSAVHNAGLVTLTSTPMGAEAQIRELLGRPENERLYLLMPVGYPKGGANVQVPNIKRKPLKEICSVH